MNTHRIATMVTAVALTSFVQTLIAQEKIDVSPADNTPSQNASEQKPEAGITMPETTTPVQAFAQPADKLLSEMKVYPSF